MSTVSIPLRQFCNLQSNYKPTTCLIMALPYICSFPFLPQPLPQLLQIIGRITLILDEILSYVGVRPLQEISHNQLAASSNLLEAIKRELPEVEFASLYSKKPHGNNAEYECVVCLRWLEAKDAVRELGSCDHAFHTECIDRWICVGHVTCPLCRSQLLGSGRN